ncbi:MAG: hypothetical protein ACFFEY_18475 [Candidatus Thorarchaeota archaeon]
MEEIVFVNAKMIMNNGKIFCFETGLKFNVENFLKYARKMMSRSNNGDKILSYLKGKNVIKESGVVVGELL